MTAAPWVLVTRLAFQGRLSSRESRIASMLGVSARVAFLLCAPAFSNDVFRYIYEGRLVWWAGPEFVFSHAPAEAPALGVPQALLDEAWLRINHPHIPTIYPPLTQLTFALSGGLSQILSLPPLPTLKLFLVTADLGTWWLIAKCLKHQSVPPQLALAWGLCPLAILEIAREGHADSLSTFGIALGAYGFVRGRPKQGYTGWTLAALAKLNGIVILPAALRTTRKGIISAGLFGLLAGVPWVLLSLEANSGLSQYASRWRAGDGLFTLLLKVAELSLGGPWRQFESFTLTDHQLARLWVVLLFTLYIAVILWRNEGMAAIPYKANCLLLVLLLLSPTVHPWYVLWLLPLAALNLGRTVGRATLAFVFLAPLLHHPGWIELTRGTWTDLGSIRALVHIPVWLLFTLGRHHHPKSQPEESPAVAVDHRAHPYSNAT